MMLLGETTNVQETQFADKHMTNYKPLSYEYIRGLTDGEGCFTFYTGKETKKNGRIKIYKVPAFCIRMHVRDKELLEMVKQTLGLRANVYTFKAYRKDGYNRGESAALIIRGVGALKNKIVPLFYGKLKGFKKKQFESWLENIGKDPLVRPGYKIIHRLHTYGYYLRNPWKE